MKAKKNSARIVETDPLRGQGLCQPRPLPPPTTPRIRQISEIPDWHAVRLPPVTTLSMKPELLGYRDPPPIDPALPLTPPQVA